MISKILSNLDQKETDHFEITSETDLEAIFGDLDVDDVEEINSQICSMWLKSISPKDPSRTLLILIELYLIVSTFS